MFLGRIFSENSDLFPFISLLPMFLILYSSLQSVFADALESFNFY